MPWIMRISLKIFSCLFGVILRAAAEDGYVPSADLPKIEYSIEHVFPRDAKTFTQGFYFHEGHLIEGVGGYGRSEIRLTEPGEMAPIRSQRFPMRFFGEGVTLFEGKIYQLTWQREIGFVFDPKTLKLISRFEYEGEGWGITADETHLIMSNGSEILSFRDSKDFTEVKKVKVQDGEKVVMDLNELEWVEGQIFANIWHSDWIVRIDPKTGKVTGGLDASQLLQPRPANPEAVLNGIAYDPSKKELYLTGKLWPKIFKIKLKD